MTRWSATVEHDECNWHPVNLKQRLSDWNAAFDAISEFIDILFALFSLIFCCVNFFVPFDLGFPSIFTIHLDVVAIACSVGATTTALRYFAVAELLWRLLQLTADIKHVVPSFWRQSSPKVPMFLVAKTHSQWTHYRNCFSNRKLDANYDHKSSSATKLLASRPSHILNELIFRQILISPKCSI